MRNIKALTVEVTVLHIQFVLRNIQIINKIVLI